jgi:hypothetical protein
MLPIHVLAVKVALSPSQHSVLLAVTTGADGLLLVPIIITVLLALSPQSLIHLAE